MRIFILVAMILLSAPSVLMGQDVRFGFKGGLNFSTVAQEDFKSNSKTSFHAGGVMEALYDNNIAIQPEIVFSVQGFTFMDQTKMNDITFTYINVPVMVKYYIFKGMSIEAGPQIGFRNTARLETTENGQQATQNIKLGIRSNDLSVDAGISLHVANGFSLNARYCHGLTNISILQRGELYKNRVLQLSLGYLF